MVTEPAITLLLAVTFLWLFFWHCADFASRHCPRSQAQRYARAWQQLRADWRLGTDMLLQAALREDGTTLLAQAFSRNLDHRQIGKPF